MYSQDDRRANEQEFLGLLTCIESLTDQISITADMISVPEFRKYFTEIVGMRRYHGYISADRLADIGLDELYRHLLTYSDYYYGEELDEFRERQETIRDAYAQESARWLIDRYTNGSITVGELAGKLEKLSTNEVYHHHPATYEEIMDAITRKVERIPMGRYGDFNGVLNLQVHDLCTITAETSAGKTALALNFLSEMVPEMPCIYLNMEMSEPQIYRRLAGIRTGMAVSKLEETDQLSATEMQLLEDEMRNLAEPQNLEVISAVQTVRSIKNIVTTHDQSKPFAVFVDHMGFVSDDEKKYQNNTLMLDAIMRELRALSLTFNCTIVNICQMSRPKDSNAASISRLKGSSEIEQSSVQVLAIQRFTDDDGESYRIDILKNRNGQTGRFYNVNFNKQNQRFDIFSDQFE